jgi:tRNA A37 threonylcarbamoyladenosine dehydratase
VAINPACQVEHDDRGLRHAGQRRSACSDRGFDFVIDAIDQARTKAAMIAWCKRHGVPVITAGGAGGQIDPGRIEIADLARTIQDPLLAKVRSYCARNTVSRATQRRNSASRRCTPASPCAIRKAAPVATNRRRWPGSTAPATVHRSA